MGPEETDEKNAERHVREAMLLALRLAATTFCDRVEIGEIRSTRSYREFCLALGREPKLEDAIARSIIAQIEGR